MNFDRCSCFLVLLTKQVDYSKNYVNVPANYTQYLRLPLRWKSNLTGIFVRGDAIYTQDSGQKNCTVIGTPILSS